MKLETKQYITLIANKVREKIEQQFPETITYRFNRQTQKVETILNLQRIPADNISANPTILIELIQETQAFLKEITCKASKKYIHEQLLPKLYICTIYRDYINLKEELVTTTLTELLTYDQP
ncbi:5453_t:CDS:1 [Racocetra persica]|uniref:5453_t:CDS:1 n=1 Tax=Racocetra persica TaxID=160502 RepID=A0ACA9LYW0_9GLOM|nr:5453_t:CDS:1 [Racocetra persica]